MNQTEKQQAADAAIARRMVTLLGGDRTDADFFVGNLKYQQGIEWVRRAFPKEWEAGLLASPLFWTWWKDKWAALDQVMDGRMVVVKGTLVYSVRREGEVLRNPDNHGVRATDTFPLTHFYHTAEDFMMGYPMYHSIYAQALTMEPAILVEIKKEIAFGVMARFTGLEK